MQDRTRKTERPCRSRYYKAERSEQSIFLFLALSSHTYTINRKNTNKKMMKKRGKRKIKAILIRVIVVVFIQLALSPFIRRLPLASFFFLLFLSSIHSIVSCLCSFTQFYPHKENIEQKHRHSACHIPIGVQTMEEQQLRR